MGTHRHGLGWSTHRHGLGWRYPQAWAGLDLYVEPAEQPVDFAAFAVGGGDAALELHLRQQGAPVLSSAMGTHSGPSYAVLPCGYYGHQGATTHGTTVPQYSHSTTGVPAAP